VQTVVLPPFSCAIGLKNSRCRILARRLADFDSTSSRWWLNGGSILVLDFGSGLVATAALL
jgi:hypothetical protein